MSSKSDIFNNLNEAIQNHFAILFDMYSKATETGLLQLAEMASSNVKQRRLLEAQALFKQHQQTIKLQCLQAIILEPNHCETMFDVQYDDPSQVSNAIISHKNMELIDLVQFEDWLSLEIIIKRANQRYLQAQNYLARRYSLLLEQPLSIEQLPISVHALCHSLKKGLKTYEFDPDILPLIYRFFDEAVICNLDELYQLLNNIFSQNGFIANIESQPLTQVTSKHSSSKNTQVMSDNPSYPSAPELIQTVQQFQNLIHNTETESSTRENQHDPKIIKELVAHLTQLQGDADTTNSNRSLLDLLNSTTNIQTTGATLDQIQLVDNIFSTIDSYPYISKSLQNAIKNLLVPIAKTTLIDPRFFSSKDHPARTLLNQMIELSVNSEIPNSSLENQFNTIVADINNNFESDVTIFESAIKTLSTIAELQTKTYKKNSQRLVQSYEGKQKLKQANDSVEEEVNLRIQPPKAPQVIVDLMENGWKELLKITYLKLGIDNKTWIENLNIIDQLLSIIKHIDKVINDSRAKEEALKLVDIIEQKLTSSFPQDYRYADTIDQIRYTINGTRAVNTVSISPKISALHHLANELTTSKPETVRWVKYAEKILIGDEFTHINDDSGKKNVKLAWASKDKQHFLFVNNRGQKALELDLIDLANEFARGLIPVASKSELPLVERSLYSTIQQAYETLAYRSNHDELTNLINRKECEKHLMQVIADARAHSHYYGLLYIDIDQFSLVNNLHGHIAGDQQLIAISQLIAKHIPIDATAARMAGNEFVVVLKNQDQQAYLKICEDLRAEIENHPFNWEAHSIHLTASIGLITINHLTEGVIDLMRNAIEACQTAKKNGGNRFYDFRQDSELHTRREKLLSWIDKLDHLLISDKLVLRAQSIVPALATDEEPHYEILLALKNEHGELISPIEFIEAAENFGRMKKVDRWVIDKSFQWLHSIESSPFKAPSISINLSANSLNDNSFSDFLLGKLEQYKIPTRKICFEVTETATINNIAEVANFIREIKKMGCKFSLDDFGSGNASYQYLRHLPVDYVKIDGLFVQDIDNNTDDYALVKSINEIAHLLGKKTIAEYAESVAIIDKLKHIGVDYLQGYAISKPQILDIIHLERH